MSVNVKNNNLEIAIKRFKTQVVKNGTLSKAKERAEGYKKPGICRREEKKNNIKNSKKNSKYY